MELTVHYRPSARRFHRPHPGSAVVMMAVGGVLIWLAIKYEYEPLLLLPIGLGCILANIPGTGMLDEGGLLKVLYKAGIENELFPSLVFIGIGAMTDFGPLLENPKLCALWRSGPVRHLWHAAGRHAALGFQHQRGRLHRHHRRRRWPHVDLCGLGAGARPGGPHHRGGLFVHVAGARSSSRR